jgi:hypothetical protein
VRFLPEFDNVLLSHADWRRVIADDHRRRISTRNGMVPGSVLVYGFFRGTWKVRRIPTRTTLVIEPYERLRKADRVALLEEGQRLLGFIAGVAAARQIEIARSS